MSHSKTVTVECLRWLNMLFFPIKHTLSSPAQQTQNRSFSQIPFWLHSWMHFGSGLLVRCQQMYQIYTIIYWFAEKDFLQVHTWHVTCPYFKENTISQHAMYKETPLNNQSVVDYIGSPMTFRFFVSWNDNVTSFQPLILHSRATQWKEHSTRL